MPTYDYRCRSCRERVTVQHSLSEEPQLICPRCGSDRMERLISRVWIVMSSKSRARDVSWIDRSLAARLRKKVSGKLNPPLRDTLDRMEKS
jgi:putative FmdB family regulatory protein